MFLVFCCLGLFPGLLFEATFLIFYRGYVPRVFVAWACSQVYYLRLRSSYFTEATFLVFLLLGLVPRFII